MAGDRRPRRREPPREGARGGGSCEEDVQEPPAGGVGDRAIGSGRGSGALKCNHLVTHHSRGAGCDATIRPLRPSHGERFPNVHAGRDVTRDAENLCRRSSVSANVSQRWSRNRNSGGPMKLTPYRLGSLLALVSLASACASSAPVGITKSEALVAGCSKVG